MTEREYVCAHCHQVVVVASSDGKRPSDAGCNHSSGKHNWVEQH